MLVTLKCEMCSANLRPQDGSDFIVCEFCGATNMLVKTGGAASANTPPDKDIVFAQWSHDGYFYPARIGEKFEKHTKVFFLDGDVATVDNEQIVETQHALGTFALEGNWENQGGFFAGRLSSRQPLIMNYDDGDVEQVDISQLRGARPGDSVKVIRKSGGCLTLLVWLAAIIFVLAFAANV